MMRSLSLFVSISLVFFCGLTAVNAADDKVDLGDADRHVKIRWRTEIPIPVGSKYLRLWLPYPVSDENQTVENVRVSGNFDQSGIYRENIHGNLMQYVRWMQFRGTAWIELSFEIRRKERIQRNLQDGSQETPTELSRYLWIDPKTRFDIREVLEQLDCEGLSLLERARKVYDHVVDNFDRDPKIVGCGTGNVPDFLRSRMGKCADFSTMFVTLCRAVGVPCREVYGTRTGKSVKGDISDAYHCWTEFYLPGTGWVAADPADVRKFTRSNGMELDHPKAKEKREYFFGGIDKYRIRLAHGSDIRLAPAQELSSLTYFMCPYLEIGYQSSCNGADIKHMDLVGLKFSGTYYELEERRSLIGVGEKAPIFCGETADGQVVKIEDYLGKKIVVINFFATWCGRCNWESKGLNRIAREYADKDVAVLRVSFNEKRAKVLNFVEKHEIEFPVLVDPDRTLCELFGLKYVPTNIIINTDGVIYFVSGLLPEEDLRRQIDLVIKSKAD